MTTTDESEREEEEELCDAPPNEQNEKHRFTIEEIRKMHDACSATFDSLLVSILFSTGIRVGGFVRILTKSVATHNGTQWVIHNRAYTREKGNKTRKFPLFPVVQQLLHRWLNGKDEVHCGSRRPLSLSPYLFPSFEHEYGHVSAKHVRRVFLRLANKANVSGPHVHLHATRHTTAFQLFEAGNRTEHVAAFLGHGTQTCEQYYLKFSHSEIMRNLKLPPIMADTFTTTPAVMDPTMQTTTEVPAAQHTDRKDRTQQRKHVPKVAGGLERYKPPKKRYRQQIYELASSLESVPPSLSSELFSLARSRDTSSRRS